jgi:hypothetical protein
MNDGNNSYIDTATHALLAVTPLAIVGAVVLHVLIDPGERRTLPGHQSGSRATHARRAAAAR